MMTSNNNQCYLEEYMRGIDKGIYPVSERFKSYLHTLCEEKDNGHYIYNTSEADKRIKFIETFVKQSKGAYTGKPMQLSLWQKAFIECIFSFYDKGTGKRRFTEVLLLVARKNGKSTLMSALALYELLINAGSSTACLSNDDSQAKLIFEECDNMRRQVDSKDKLTGRNILKIYNRKNFSQIFRMSSKQNSLDGKNISLAFFDEAHECRDDNIYQAGLRAMGMQEEPLLIICTTQGFIRDKFLDQKIQLAHRIQDNEEEAPYFLPWLYEMDSEDEIWQDEKSWEKANPSMHEGIKKLSYMRQQVDRARYSQSDRTHLLVKDFNFIARGGQNWLSPKQLQCSKQDNLQDLKEIAGTSWIWCTVGIDISLTTDLTACTLLYKVPNDEDFHILTHYWIPKAKIDTSPDTKANANYEDWQKKGYISIESGAEITTDCITNWLKDMAITYRLRPAYIGYDRWQANVLIKDLEAEGFDTLPIKQGYGLSNALYLLSDLLDTSKIKGITEIDSWCLSNLTVKTDSDGSIRPAKPKNSTKIDGAISLLMAIQTYREKRKDMDDAWAD